MSGNANARGARVWLRHPSGRVEVAALVVAIAGVGIGIPAFFDSLGPSTPEEHVAACRESHDMEEQRREAGTAGALPVDGPTTVHPSCAWPPPSWADDDGYSEIRVARVPVSDLDVEGPYNRIDIVDGCHRYRLEYDYGNMEHFPAPEPPIYAEDGDVIEVETGEHSLSWDYEQWLPPSYRDHVNVLAHHRYQGPAASCVPPDA